MRGATSALHDSESGNSAEQSHDDTVWVNIFRFLFNPPQSGRFSRLHSGLYRPAHEKTAGKSGPAEISLDTWRKGTL